MWTEKLHGDLEQSKALIEDHEDSGSDVDSENLTWSEKTSHLRQLLSRRQQIWRSLGLPSKSNHTSICAKHTKLALCMVLASLVFWISYRIISSLSLPKSGSFMDAGHEVFVKPAGVKVIGLMFFGRPMFVNILDCYLRQNLAVNGGYLDEVHFIANTFHEEDLDYLDTLVADTPQYIRVNQTGTWFKLWNYTANFAPEDIVIKLDDDLVYLHEDAIPRLVHGMIDHPEAFAISGHIINNPHTQFFQYHTGALLPYLPENTTTPAQIPTSWRASELPRFNDTPPNHFDWETNRKPQHFMTRWLPLEATPSNLAKTPAVNATWPNPKGGGTMFRYDDGYIDSWQMAAQVHYSFLDHLERDDLERYYALGPCGALWDQQFERYSINFMAVRAGDVADRGMWPNDEIAITMRVGKKLDKKFLVDTRAYAVHYSFSTQHRLLQTDLLTRWMLYANERVCAADNQKEMMESSMVRTSG